MIKEKELIKINKRRIYLGVVLILIGLLWILSNLNIIDINLYNIFSKLIRGLFDLWPLILIIIGVSFIFKKEMLDTILWGLFIVIIVLYSFFVKDPVGRNNGRGFIKNEEIALVMEDSIEKGKLDLDIGASNLEVGSTAFEFLSLEQDGAYEYKVESKSSVEEVYIKSKDDFLNYREERDLSVGLNNKIPWEINFNVGAISGDIDLKDIIVDYISIDMGAGDLEFTLGGKNDFTMVDVDAGASKVVLNVPRDMGLRIKFDGGLSSNNFKELNLIETQENRFESKNYDSASSQLEVVIDMGVGNFNINYY